MVSPILVLGTRNLKKRGELEDLLSLPELQLKTLDGFGNVPDVVEDGETFLDNATKKAVELSQVLSEWVLGEDSGLAVDALGGRPGVFSARYAGEPCDDERNNDKLLHELAGVPTEQRGAHYICTAVVADPRGNIRATAEGRCDGIIAEQRHGKGGFGYDPLFYLPDAGKTFGELPIAVKHQRSHRAQAMENLRPQLKALLSAWFV